MCYEQFSVAERFKGSVVEYLILEWLIITTIIYGKFTLMHRLKVETISLLK